MTLADRTDAELFADAAAIRAEQERRDTLARIPDAITDLSRAYTESGGDPADLVQALTPEQAAALG